MYGNTSKFKPEFKALWDTKVKAQVAKCSSEAANLLKLEDESVSKEEKKKLSEELQSKGYRDLVGHYYISRMGYAIEHALADGRVDLGFIQCFTQVRGCLNSESYWYNVFNDDFTSEEAKDLLKLKDMLNELSKYL